MPQRVSASYLTRTDECQGRGVGARDELYGDDPGPSHSPAGALQPLRRRARRSAVTDPAPQGRVVRHTGEHVGEICPHVPILDVPVPQMGDQVVVVLRNFDLPSVEQVIAVPKISFDWVPQRSAVRRPQKAEQLVEVPTEPGFALAVIAVKALGRSAEQIGDIPVPQVRRRGGGGLQGSGAGQGSTAADVEQIVEIPARNRGLQGFRPGQGSNASSSSRLLDDAEEGIQGSFCTLPLPKTKVCR